MRSAGTGVIPAKSCFRSIAAARNDRIVAVVHKKMQLGVSDAPGNGRELRHAEPQLFIERANLIAKADFAKAVETVADIETDVGRIAE